MQSLVYVSLLERLRGKSGRLRVEFKRFETYLLGSLEKGPSEVDAARDGLIYSFHYESGSMNMRWLGLFLAGVLFVPSMAKATVVISIDMDPGTAGIQDSLIIPAGSTDNFTVNIVGTFSNNLEVSYFSFTVRLDDQELDFISRTRNNVAGLSPFSSGTPQVPGSGYAPMGGGPHLDIQGFDAIDFNNGSSIPDGTYILGTLTLKPTAVDNFLQTQLVDILPGLFNNPGTAGTADGVDGFAGPDFNFLDSSGFTFNGGKISAVPEPSSMVALGVIAVGGAVVRHRRRKVAATK